MLNREKYKKISVNQRSYQRISASTKTGFTLIESMMSVVLLALIMGAVYGFICWGYQTYNFTFQQNQAVRKANFGIEVMVKEIREARGGNDGSYLIEKADDNEIIFYSNVDNDDDTERVRYFLQGNIFKREIINPIGWPIYYPEEEEYKNTIVLSEYVRNDVADPVFTYYNGDWPGDIINNPLSSPDRISETRLVHIYLKVNVDPNSLPNDFELESDAQIRNLK